MRSFEEEGLVVSTVLLAAGGSFFESDEPLIFFDGPGTAAIGS